MNEKSKSKSKKNHIAFLCLHAGINHKSSRDMLELIEKINLSNVIIPIQIDDNDTKHLIQYNTKGIQITKLPSFVIARNNQKTLVYYIEDIDEVIQIANDIYQSI